ncbi:hypothetical protein IC575_030371 [Cucumis melo]
MKCLTFKVQRIRLEAESPQILCSFFRKQILCSKGVHYSITLQIEVRRKSTKKESIQKGVAYVKVRRRSLNE